MRKMTTLSKTILKHPEAYRDMNALKYSDEPITDEAWLAEY